MYKKYEKKNIQNASVFKFFYACFPNCFITEWINAQQSLKSSRETKKQIEYNDLNHDFIQRQ